MEIGNNVYERLNNMMNIYNTCHHGIKVYELYKLVQDFIVFSYHANNHELSLQKGSNPNI